MTNELLESIMAFSNRNEVKCLEDLNNPYEENTDIEYLMWIFKAYGALIANTDKVKNNPVYAKDYIDYKWVAITSEYIGKKTFYPVTYQAIKNEYPINKIVSLGAGKATLAIKVLKENESARAVIIDRSVEACEEARKSILLENLSDRAEVITLDVVDLFLHQEFLENADVVEMAFLSHDLYNALGEKRFAELLNLIGKCISKRGKIFLTDAIKASSDSHWFSKVFTWIHTLQNIELLDDSQWKRCFELAGLEVFYEEDAKMHESKLYCLKKRN